MELKQVIKNHEHSVLKIFSVILAYILSGVQSQSVEIGQICLEVGFSAEIQCDVNAGSGGTVVSVTWRRSATSVPDYPPDGTLAQYHFIAGVTIPDEYKDRINMTDSYSLIFYTVEEQDNDARYWCQANLQVDTFFDYGDSVPGGISRAQPYISTDGTTTCTEENNIYTCQKDEVIRCAASDFSPNDTFSMEWNCEVGSQGDLIITDKNGQNFDASRDLTEFDMGREQVVCSCSTSGKANCKSGPLTLDITISVEEDPGPGPDPCEPNPCGSERKCVIDETDETGFKCIELTCSEKRSCLIGAVGGVLGVVAVLLVCLYCQLKKPCILKNPIERVSFPEPKATAMIPAIPKIGACYIDAKDPSIIIIEVKTENNSIKVTYTAEIGDRVEKDLEPDDKGIIKFDTGRDKKNGCTLSLSAQTETVRSKTETETVKIDIPAMPEIKECYINVNEPSIIVIKLQPREWYDNKVITYTANIDSTHVTDLVPDDKGIIKVEKGSNKIHGCEVSLAAQTQTGKSFPVQKIAKIQFYE